MTLLEEELRKLPVERLRQLARHRLPNLADAAKAELSDRPADLTEVLRQEVFPPHPHR